jgi:hypothetical protein
MDGGELGSGAVGVEASRASEGEDMTVRSRRRMATCEAYFVQIERCR